MTKRVLIYALRWIMAILSFGLCLFFMLIIRDPVGMFASLILGVLTVPE